jgi:hypothetical protein
MKNSYNIALIICCLTLMFSCKKDIVGNPITIEAYSNVPITYFGLYKSCQAGPGGYPAFAPDPLTDSGNGNYSYEIESGYGRSQCFTIGGTIPASSDTTGKTTVNIDVFYTEEGNVVGFQDIELKRPHGEHQIRYEIRPDTYLED